VDMGETTPIKRESGPATAGEGLPAASRATIKQDESGP
jgi:hypothetical protein